MSVTLPKARSVISWRGFPVYLWSDCGRHVVAFGCCDLEFPTEHDLKAHCRTPGAHAPIRLCSHGPEAITPKETREPGEEPTA